ncbi:helix-turn-helix domain-containing protein [Gordonia polyisoprenivorans]|uniref:helix-turn-helix transcriptional regulator n=1 Tax=Gordonia polyisoprenivorans TaxID=84595 RepID=UPI001B8A9C1E|nr:helix-turn-helix domain-containing protein [Gordonia polyisoprenivorans]QUD82104.1 helix-turn-helix domain-containing protein [Gordonia polyisoprenivorans]
MEVSAPSNERMLLSTKQVSEEFGIPINTLRTWRYRGGGPPSFTIGKAKVVYRRGEVERWICDQEMAATNAGDVA